MRLSTMNVPSRQYLWTMDSCLRGSSSSAGMGVSPPKIPRTTPWWASQQFQPLTIFNYMLIDILRDRGCSEHEGLRNQFHRGFRWHVFDPAWCVGSGKILSCILLWNAGNTYFIENIADRDSKLFFTCARKLSENETPTGVMLDFDDHGDAMQEGSSRGDSRRVRFTDISGQ